MFLQVEIILISKLLVTTKLKNYVMYFVHFKKNHTHTKKKPNNKKSWCTLGLDVLVLAIFILRLDKHVF